MIQFENPDGTPAVEIPEPPKKARESIGWRGILVSVAFHAIFILLAIFVLYKWVTPPQPPPPNFVPGGGGGNEGQTANKVQTQIRRATMDTSTRKVAIEGEASFTLPENSTELVDPGLPAVREISSSGSGGGGGGGKGGGLGNGVGKGSGPGSGPGFGAGFATAISPFGSKTELKGSMPGIFYDFKQTKEGKPVERYDTQHYEDYTTKVEDIHRANFRDTAFKKFFRAPDPLYLTQVAIPFSDASTGPAFFGVADKVKPAGWFVHYSGQVMVDRDMQVRFVGAADDYMSVFINGQARLIATWPGVRGLLVGRWEPHDPLDEQAPSPVGGCPVTRGDWVKLKKGQSVNFDIAIGECPGGKVGFVLMVEEKDAKYRNGSNGPVLPLFTTEAIRPETKERVLKDFPNWEFDWENVPVFPVVAKTEGL